ncbi:MAG: hypothetical protein U9Q74_01560 [Gemmatimonadota bacterium]|nr:hypothetical protein [Gemmatimonadota bacterium]
MTLLTQSTRAALAGLLAMSLTGCATLHMPGVPARPPVMLEVDNRNDQAFDVFAVSPGGAAQRLGMVMGFNTGTFKLPAYATATGTVRVVAVPIGGFGAAGSGSLSVRDGDTIEFTIQQVLSWSSAIVR